MSEVKEEVVETTPEVTPEVEAAPAPEATPEATAPEATPAPEAEPAAPAAAPAPKNVNACLAFIPVLFFLPMVTDAKDDPVAKNSSQQALTLLALYLALYVLGMIFGFLPVIGFFLLQVLMIARYVLAACTIIGMVRAYNNKIWKLPVLGDLDIMQKLKGDK